MKKITFILLLSLLLLPLSAFAKDEKDGKVTFTEKGHDFGNIKEANGKVHYDFIFTNTGGKPVVILNAITTCGCTKADYPKHPIKPNETGVITVTFNPRDYTGEFLKVITVRTPNQRIKLKISGVVIPKNVQ